MGLIGRSVVAVPARLASSRLPNKLLAKIGDRPMLQHVLERCAQADGPAEVVLCTDSEKLSYLAQDWGFRVLMTSRHCTSGSERIASVVAELAALAWGESALAWGTKETLEHLRTTAIVNVQGDQPFIDSAMITNMVARFTLRDPMPSVITPVYRLDPKAVHDPNIVKVAVAHDWRALYFSRSAIPHVRDVDPNHWADHANYWGHVGTYCFRGDILASWFCFPPSPLEDLERLEQLRLIEAGQTIITFPIQSTSLSVDTPEQLEHARRLAKFTNGA